MESFSKIRADIAIIGAGGISSEGVSNSHGLLIEIQRAMIRAAQKVVLCLDHSKFGRQSLSTLCPLDVIDVLVTDRPPPAPLAESLARQGVQVLVATA